MFVTPGDKRSALIVNVKRVARAVSECLGALDARERAAAEGGG
jgi:hypothetical protein